MALNTVNPPKRIPPASGPLPLPKPAVPPSVPAVGLSNTLTSDAYALQAHVDNLANEFDSLRAQLRHAQKLAALGTTAAMIAHEFNNMLTPVVAYASEALSRDDVELMRTALKKTLERADTMRAMIDRVVGLAKHGDAGLRAVKVLEVVESAVGCIGRDLAKDNITLQMQIDADLTVRANENQLLQVLFNLVNNARQAMLGRRGRLSIDANASKGGQVEINIRDTGCGISAEDLPHIFEPFFSTKLDAAKPDQRGLGLGLSICCDIIEELNGQIAVASQPGTSTTFTITLPQAD